MTDKIITRFAPSPTGYLHLGNARTAFLNFLFAREKGGEFILRIDDTDKVRSKDEYKVALEEDLAWLGITYERTFSQSARVAEYAAAAEMLKAKGLLYRCYETEEELVVARRAALAASRPPVYDRAGLKMSEAAHKEKEEAGVRPHWRFKLSQGDVLFQDLIHGETKVKTDSLSDPVLIRADGSFLYTLPSVCDDLAFGITHIIRGDDHLTNSAVQVELALALGARTSGSESAPLILAGSAPVVFAHHPLMVNEDGSPLSKRHGDFSLRKFREEGFEAEAVAHLLVGKDFNFQAQAGKNIRYERARLEKLNGALVHQMEWAQARSRLPNSISEQDWFGLRANLTLLKDAELWHSIIAGDGAGFEKTAPDTAPDFFQQALQLLPPAPLNESSWQVWTKALSAATALKGKALYLPLRLALTGQNAGPEMKNVILLLGRDKIKARLSNSLII